MPRDLGHNGNGQNGSGHNGNGHNGNGHNGNGHNANRPIAGDRAVAGASSDDRLGPQLPFLGVTVSVVIPALDEARNLPHVLPQIPPWVDEVVLVDGGSEDETLEVARSLLPAIRVIEELRPGKGAALQTGFAAARGDIIVTLDADGSADPAEIPAFVGCLLAGADFAKGSRFIQGGGTTDMERLRRAGNWGLKRLVKVAFGGHYSDLCYGYNAFWRHLLPVIDGEADGFEIETLMNVRVLAAGMRVTEVASHEARRIHGQSHLKTFRDGFRVLRTIIREWWRLPRRAGRAVASPAGWNRPSLPDRRLTAGDRRKGDRRDELTARSPRMNDRRAGLERRIAARQRRLHSDHRGCGLEVLVGLRSSGQWGEEFGAAIADPAMGGAPSA
jgi:hypothetical protein